MLRRPCCSGAVQGGDMEADAGDMPTLGMAYGYRASGAVHLDGGWQPGTDPWDHHDGAVAVADGGHARH